MKPSILIATLLACATLAHASEPSKPGKASNALTKENIGGTAYATTPIDITAERLPANFRGHSIFDVIKKLKPPTKKEEFEKTDEYEVRLNRWTSSPFLGTITPSDLLAFEISEFMAPDAIKIKYDADAETMTAQIAFENRYFREGHARWLETYYRAKDLGSQMGVTRMGVKFRITSHSGASVGIGIKEQIDPISISAPMTRDKALRTKPLLVAFAIVSVVEPYKIDESTSSTASLDDPNEWLNQYWGLWASLRAIWLVNRSTGEILAKAEAPFATCNFGVC